MIKSIAPLGAVALLSQLAGQAEAGIGDLDTYIEDLKKIEPINCGKALAALGDVWINDKKCIDDFNAIGEFFEAIRFPSFSVDKLGIPPEVSFDRGELPQAPDIDYPELCADGGCIFQVAELHKEIDEKCTSENLEKLIPGLSDAANTIRATRAFTNVLCVKNDDDDYCLEKFVSNLRSYNPMDDDSDPGIREALCSECSKNVQASLFGSLAPEFAYKTAHMYCHKDDDGAYCRKRDLFMGASYAKVLFEAWDLVYDEEDICTTPCAAQAVVSAGGTPPSQCFEDSGGVLSYSFKFVSQRSGLKEEDVQDFIEALKEDIADALGLAQEYVEVFIEEGERFVCRLRKKFAKISEKSNRELSFVEDDDELEEVVNGSPFIETNKVAGNVTVDPTRVLEVEPTTTTTTTTPPVKRGDPEVEPTTTTTTTTPPVKRGDPDDSSSPRASSLAALAVAAAALVGNIL